MDSLAVFWRSAEAADNVEHAEFVCGKLVQFLRYNAIMSENQINACPILVLSWVRLDYKWR